MPIFFFISGLTFGENDKLPFKDYAKKRVKGLIIPYLFLNIICYIIKVIYPLNPKSIEFGNRIYPNQNNF